MKATAANDTCQVIENRRPCPQRAEYLARTLIDTLPVCADHLQWACDRLRMQGLKGYPGDEIVDVTLLHPQDWPSGVAGLWTTVQAAAHWRVSPSTYRDYISSGYAPEPVQHRDPMTGGKLHDAGAVRTAFAARPGQGHRSDLRARSDQNGTG